MENTMPQTLNKVLHDPFIFLAHAVRLEEEAAAGFSELADAMDTLGNPDAAEFFRRMAEFSRRHLAQARARVGARPLPELGPMTNTICSSARGRWRKFFPFAAGCATGRKRKP